MTSTIAEAGIYKGSFLIDAEASRVWAAMTEPAQLCVWFTEKAEIDLRVGGAYRFWGKHTPTLGVAGAADQTITDVVDEKLLVFTWTWGGVAGVVTLGLVGGDDGTELRIEHAWDGEMHPHLVADFWELAAGNLRSYMRTGKPALLPDHSAFRETVDLSIEIDASAERVWEVITEPSEMRKFLGELMACAPAADLRVGGVYSYGWEQDGKKIGPQEILELEEGKRLVHSWLGDDGVTVSKTEWVVESLGANKSRLSVTQFGMGDLKEFSGYANGWASFLLAMKRVGEEGA